MEIRQLEMLIAVVEKKGYMSAGEHLHVSHSAIHRQIRLIEEELGEKVFVRQGRKVRLTETGKLVAELGLRMKREVNAVLQQIKDMRELARGSLRIGTGTTSLIFFLPPVIRSFRKKYPNFDVHVATGTADNLIQDLLAGHLDLGLINEPINEWAGEKHLCHQRLYAEEFVLAVSRRHHFGRRHRIDWSDLKGVPIVSFPRATNIRRLIDAYFERACVVAEIAMELENEEAIEKMIDISMGAGFIAKRRVLKSRLHSVLVGDAPIVLNVAAVWNGSYTPRSVREFLTLCRAHASEHP